MHSCARRIAFNASSASISESELAPLSSSRAQSSLIIEESPTTIMNKSRYQLKTTSRNQSNFSLFRFLATFSAIVKMSSTVTSPFLSHAIISLLSSSPHCNKERAFPGLPSLKPATNLASLSEISTFDCRIPITSSRLNRLKHIN